MILELPRVNRLNRKLTKFTYKATKEYQNYNES